MLAESMTLALVVMLLCSVGSGAAGNTYGGPFAIALMLGAATFCFGQHQGCRRAEILSVNDSGKYCFSLHGHSFGHKSHWKSSVMAVMRLDMHNPKIDVCAGCSQQGLLVAEEAVMCCGLVAELPSALLQCPHQDGWPCYYDSYQALGHNKELERH